MEDRKTMARRGMRGLGEGQIIEVQGGHIIRATGRNDRHTKVCTPKGPRDRRVRLSAHTAIQFYDVQDRLGCDKPSKAVDWLLKKAKAAIDELAELPPCHPTTTTNFKTATTATTNASSQQEQIAHGNVANSVEEANDYTLQNEQTMNENNSSFMPPMDSDSIAYTINTFFPTGALADRTSTSGMNFYPPDMLSRTSSNSQNNQDLRLLLQSFQDSQFLQTHHPHQQHPDQTHQGVYRNRMGFDTSSRGAVWSEHQSADINRFQRLVAWNNAGGEESGEERFIFNSLPPRPLSQSSLQQLFGQSDLYFTQRGPLQSSYSGNMSSDLAWIEQPFANHHQTLQDHSSTLSGIGNYQTPSAFSGLQIPVRIRGEYEEQDGIHNNQSSASPDSRH